MRACRVELGLRRIALTDQLIELGLLVGERGAGIGQGLDGVVLAGLCVFDGLVGLLLREPGRGFAVGQFGPGALQVGDGLLRADGQRLAGGGGVDHLAGIGRGQVIDRGPVDVGGLGVLVEMRLGGRDGRIRVLESALAGVDLLLCRRGVVAGGLHVGDGLVDRFLPGLDGGAEVLQLLVGVGEIRYQGCDLTAAGLGRRDTGCEHGRGHDTEYQ